MLVERVYSALLIIVQIAICQGVYELREIDTLENTGHSTLAFDIDGAPILAYNDQSKLKFVRCVNPSCSNLSSPVVLDTGNNMGLYVKIAVHPNTGKACIVYLSGLDKKIKVCCCQNRNCSLKSISEVDSVSGAVTDVEGPVAIATVAQKFNGSTTHHPIFAYSSQDRVKICFCHDFTCTNRTINKIAEVDKLSSVELLIQGELPSVFYVTNKNLSHCLCVNIKCSSCISKVDNIAEFKGGPQHVHLSLNLAGERVVVGHYTEDSAGLLFCQCENLNCSRSECRKIEKLGKFPSLAYDPVTKMTRLSFFDSLKGNFLFYDCPDHICKKVEFNETIYSESTAKIPRPTLKTRPNSNMPLLLLHQGTQLKMADFLCNGSAIQNCVISSYTQCNIKTGALEKCALCKAGFYGDICQNLCSSHESSKYCAETHEIRCEKSLGFVKYCQRCLFENLTGTICNETVIATASSSSTSSGSMLVGLVGGVVGGILILAITILIILKKKNARKISAEEKSRQEIEDAKLQKQLEEELEEEIRKNEILRRGMSIIAKPSRWKVAKHVISAVRSMSARSRKRQKVQQDQENDSEEESHVGEESNENPSTDLGAADFIAALELKEAAKREEAEAQLSQDIDEILAAN